MLLSNGYGYAYQWDRGISFATDDADGVIRKMYNQHCKATFLIPSKDGKYDIPDQLFICGKPIVVEVLKTNAGELATVGDDIFHTDSYETILIRESAKPENYIFTDEEIKAWKELSEKLTGVENRLDAVETELPKKAVVGHNHLFGNLDGVVVVEVTGDTANYKANQIQAYASQNYAIFLVRGGLVYTASSGNGVKVQFTRTKTDGTVMVAEVDYNGNVKVSEYNPVPTDEINANTEARHTHGNKDYLDKLDDDYIKSLAGGGGGGGNIEFVRFSGDSGGFFYCDKSGEYIAERLRNGVLVIGYGSPSYGATRTGFENLFSPSRIRQDEDGVKYEVIFSATESVNDEEEKTTMLRVTNELTGENDGDVFYRVRQTIVNVSEGNDKEEIYTVNCTLDGEDTGTDTNAYRTDKNYYDIENAYNDGMLVVMKTDKYVIPLTCFAPPYIFFGGVNAESGNNLALERGIMARARPLNIILTKVNIGGSVDASSVTYGDTNVADALGELNENSVNHEERILELEKGSPSESGISIALKNALKNYFTHAMPYFDDEHGESYRDAVLLALEGEEPVPPTPSNLITGYKSFAVVASLKPTISYSVSGNTLSLDWNPEYTGTKTSANTRFFALANLESGKSYRISRTAMSRNQAIYLYVIASLPDSELTPPNNATSVGTWASEDSEFTFESPIDAVGVRLQIGNMPASMDDLKIEEVTA